jgi:hypothetical protein
VNSFLLTTQAEGSPYATDSKPTNREKAANIFRAQAKNYSQFGMESNSGIPAAAWSRGLVEEFDPHEEFGV